MNILVVEDHPLLRERIAKHFFEVGFFVNSAGNGEEAVACLRHISYDLIIIDRGLPDMDGLNLLKEKGRARCLILTAWDALEDRIEGLNIGADDYMLKPFALAELEARVRAILRRGEAELPCMLHCGALSLDTVRKQAVFGSIPLNLSRREVALLEILMRSSPRTVVKDVLEDAIYNAEDAVTPNALEAVVSRLRRKLRGVAADCSIENVRGLGYRLLPIRCSDKVLS